MIELKYIKIETSVLDKFFHQTDPICQTVLKKRPYTRFIVADFLKNALGDNLISCLQEYLLSPKHGAIFCQLPNEYFDNDEQYLKLLTAFSLIFGIPCIDQMSQNYFASVDLMRQGSGDSFLTEPYHDLRLHTDGSFYPQQVDYVFLAKPREKHIEGGELTLLAINNLEGLSSFIEMEQSIEPFTFQASLSKNYNQVVIAPIFSTYQSGIQIRFSDQFCQPQSSKSAWFLHELSEAMESSRHKISIAFPEGHLLLLNNRYWLHGRKKFTALHEGFQRRLLRIRGNFFS